MNPNRRIGVVFLMACVLAGLAACQSAPCGKPAARTPELVELKEVIPDIQLDIRYATENNFTGKVVYPSARCFLVKEAALALREVQQELRPKGYRLKIFDGYRPLSVQRIFWAILPDPRYVADPAKGSRHNRGYAVDLTLTDLEGHEAPMPSEFDDFSERAHPDFSGAPPEALKNREILRDAMERHGFTRFPTEWWHFDFRGWEDKPILDISFDEIAPAKP